MRDVLVCTTFTLSLVLPQFAWAEASLLPSAAFTLRDSEPDPTDGIPEMITDAPIFIGQVTGSSAIPSNFFVEETFFEYDVSTLTSPVQSAVLDLQVFYGDIENGTGKRISYSTYAGSGVPTLSAWGIGETLTEISLPSFPSPGQMFAFSIDVTARVNAAILGNESYFGVRAFNALTRTDSPIPNAPTQVAHGPGSGVLPQVLRVELIPEPTSLVALVGGLSFLCFGRKRQHRYMH